jgi:glycosyltransferase involved in cell wall biosynthesis
VSDETSLSTRGVRLEPERDGGAETSRPHGGNTRLRMTRVPVLHLTTVPDSLGFLTGQLRYLESHGFEVHVASSPGERLGAFAEEERVRAHALAMERSITPLRDLVALWRLVKLMRRVRPLIVHAHTPKAGLLGTLAGWLARVPVRIYHLHGLRFVTTIGLRRAILRLTERIAARFATKVLCVSHSVRGVAIEDGISPPEHIDVLGGGSINGVDTARFTPVTSREAAAARVALGIPAGAVVLGYVGRIVRDKGWVELAAAWRTLRDRFPAAHLLVVGPFESTDPVPDHVVELLKTDPRIHHVGLQLDTPPLYAAMDAVVLPTYREGFPVVPLEASAMGLPVIATRVPGCVDAIVDGITGTLVPPRDVAALVHAMVRYLDDPAAGREHGANARERVLKEFSRQVIWEETHALYVRLLRAAGGSPQSGS